VSSGFRRELAENSALLCYYVASRGNLLPTFQHNISVPCSNVRNKKKNNKINFTSNQKIQSYCSKLLWVQVEVCFVFRLTWSGLTSVRVSAINCTQVELTRLYLLHVSVGFTFRLQENSYLKRAATSSVDRHGLVTSVLFLTVLTSQRWHILLEGRLTTLES
jgi:hypothetical protein